MSTPTFRFYRLDSGALTGSTFVGPDEWLAMNTPPGYGAIPETDELRARWQARRVDADGQVVAYRPDAPAETDDTAWRWDSDAERWQPVETLAAAKRRRAAAVNLARDAALAARSVGVAGVPFTVAKDRDNLAQQIQLRDVLGMPVDATTPWRDEDNVTHQFTRAQLVGLAADLGGRMAAVVAHGWTLKAAIEAASDHPALDALDLAAGWP